MFTANVKLTGGEYGSAPAQMRVCADGDCTFDYAASSGSTAIFRASWHHVSVPLQAGADEVVKIAFFFGNGLLDQLRSGGLDLLNNSNPNPKPIRSSRPLPPPPRDAFFLPFVVVSAVLAILLTLAVGASLGAAYLPAAGTPLPAVDFHGALDTTDVGQRHDAFSAVASRSTSAAWVSRLQPRMLVGLASMAGLAFASWPAWGAFVFARAPLDVAKVVVFGTVSAVAYCRGVEGSKPIFLESTLWTCAHNHACPMR